MQNFSAVLFDLDGTLVDTAPDLAYALNTLLNEHGFAELPYKQIRPVASHGAAGLLNLGFNIQPDHESYGDFQQRLLTIYADNIARESGLFEGMSEVLHQLDKQGITWGIVTNKPARFTEPLMEELGLSERAACIISGDTTPFSKPHPAPMLKALELLECQAEHCIYIGDAERDIHAGKSVDMPTILARYGYLSEEDKLADWQADAIIDHPSEILKWI